MSAHYRETSGALPAASGERRGLPQPQKTGPMGSGTRIVEGDEGTELSDYQVTTPGGSCPPPPSASGSEKAKEGASVPSPEESGSHGD